MSFKGASPSLDYDEEFVEVVPLHARPMHRQLRRQHLKSKLKNYKPTTKSTVCSRSRVLFGCVVALALLSVCLFLVYTDIRINVSAAYSRNNTFSLTQFVVQSIMGKKELTQKNVEEEVRNLQIAKEILLRLDALKSEAGDEQENITTTEPITKPVLTLFTSFKNAPDRFRIHCNVLQNWALLKPSVSPVLFNSQTDKSLVKLAKELGWLVLPVSSKNKFGTPHFREMYNDAKKASDSVFYGWSNGDLLFDTGLVETLNGISQHIGQEFNQTLVVGRRTNMKVEDRDIHNLDDIRKLASTEGKIFRADAEDYFFIAHNNFPWTKIPKLVIGRPAYDNYLVATAINYKVSVIDASKTLVALHQSGKDGDFAGHSGKNKDLYHNNKVIGKFNYGKGHTTSTQYETVYNTNHELEIWRRAVKGTKLRRKQAGYQVILDGVNYSTTAIVPVTSTTKRKPPTTTQLPTVVFTSHEPHTSATSATAAAITTANQSIKDEPTTLSQLVASSTQHTSKHLNKSTLLDRLLKDV